MYIYIKILIHILNHVLQIWDITNKHPSRCNVVQYKCNPSMWSFNPELSIRSGLLFAPEGNYRKWTTPNWCL